MVALYAIAAAAAVVSAVSLTWGAVTRQRCLLSTGCAALYVATTALVIAGLLP